LPAGLDDRVEIKWVGHRVFTAGTEPASTWRLAACRPREKPALGYVAQLLHLMAREGRPKPPTSTEPAHKSRCGDYSHSLTARPAAGQPPPMDRHDRPSFDPEHARHALGFPAHSGCRERDIADQHLAPASLEPRPVGLGVHYPYAGRPDNQVVDVGAAAGQAEVVQYHPMPPGQMLQQGRCGELSCSTPGPTVRVAARPQDQGRAAGAKRKAGDGPIRPRVTLHQPKTGCHPVGGHPKGD
jgi:hypothetical protein